MTVARRVLVRVQWHCPDGPLVDLVDEHGVIPVDATGTEDGWTVTLRFTDEESLARFYEACRQRGLALGLPEIGGPGFHRDDSYGQSSVQLETVRAALEGGYFDVPTDHYRGARRTARSLRAGGLRTAATRPKKYHELRNTYGRHLDLCLPR